MRGGWADVGIGPYETVEARTCTTNEITARIPLPSLRDTFPPGEGTPIGASVCWGCGGGIGFGPMWSSAPTKRWRHVPVPQIGFSPAFLIRPSGAPSPREKVLGVRFLVRRNKYLPPGGKGDRREAVVDEGVTSERSHPAQPEKPGSIESFAFWIPQSGIQALIRLGFAEPPSPKGRFFWGKP